MIPQRTDCITPFLVMDVLEAAQRLERCGHRVIHLEIGEPDFDTPECIKEAACRAVRDGRTHYTHSLGLIELREAICADYEKRYGADVHPDQVLVTQGTSPAMLLTFSALLEHGDQVLVSDPCYACYPNFIRFVEAEAVPVPVFEDDAFQYRPERVRQALTERTRAILINSPANPTGTLLSDERMRAVADMGREAGAFVVSDEIYHGLVYEGRERSILEFTDQAFVLNGFSKLYAMTGWRPSPRPRRTWSACAGPTTSAAACCSSGSRSWASAWAASPPGPSTCWPTPGTWPRSSAAAPSSWPSTSWKRSTWA